MNNESPNSADWVSRVLCGVSARNFLECDRRGLFESLVESGLMPEIMYRMVDEPSNSDIRIEVSVRRVRNSPAPCEWTYSMMVDAIKLQLEILRISRDLSVMVRDSHFDNIVFRKHRPLFVDVDSFIPKDLGSQIPWSAYGEFVNCMFRPTVLIRRGYEKIVRSLMAADSLFDSGLTHLHHPIIRRIIRFVHLERVLTNLQSRVNFVGTKSLLNLLSQLSTAGGSTRHLAIGEVSIQSRKLGMLLRLWRYGLNPILRLAQLWHVWYVRGVMGRHTIRRTYWSAYSYEESSKHSRLIEIQTLLKGLPLRELSATDLGGNNGSLLSSLMAHQMFCQGIVLDYDHAALELGRRQSRSVGSDLVFAKVNISNPLRPVVCDDQRFVSDVVIALAITHHLVLVDKLSFPQMFQKIVGYGRSWLIVDFMPNGLRGSEEIVSIPTWYSIENFERSLSKYAEIVNRKQFQPGRVTYLARLSKGEVIFK